MDRVRFTLTTATDWAKEHPFRFLLWVALFDGAFAGVAYWLTSEIKEGRALIVGASVVVGIVVAVVVLLAMFYVTARVRDLRFRVAALESGLESQQGLVGNLIEEKFGEPLRFLPVYHTLRSELREAARVIEHAQSTGHLWSRSESPEYDEWKKERDAIANNPWARIDNIHGELVEAYGHVKRLSENTTLRFFGNRVVRDSDDLGDALAAIGKADHALTSSIDRLEAIQESDA